MTEQSSGNLSQDVPTQPVPEPVVQDVGDEIREVPDVNGKGDTQVEVVKVEKKINPGRKATSQQNHHIPHRKV
jgi:hypothetical protein